MPPRRMTYRDFSRQIDAFAAGLEASKFTPKHKMVIWAKDTAENVVAQLGAAKVGVEVQVLGAGASSAEVSAALSDARALLFSPTLLPEEGAMKVLHELIPELKGLPERADQLVYSSQYPALRWVFNTGFERYPGMLKFEYVLSYTKESAGFAGAPGGIAFSGPGSPTSLALPFIDPDAKMPEIEPSREVC